MGKRNRIFAKLSFQHYILFHLKTRLSPETTKAQNVGTYVGDRREGCGAERVGSSTELLVRPASLKLAPVLTLLICRLDHQEKVCAQKPPS